MNSVVTTELRGHSGATALGVHSSVSLREFAHVPSSCLSFPSFCMWLPQCSCLNWVLPQSRAPQHVGERVHFLNSQLSRGYALTVTSNKVAGSGEGLPTCSPRGVSMSWPPSAPTRQLPPLWELRASGNLCDFWASNWLIGLTTEHLGRKHNVCF